MKHRFLLLFFLSSIFSSFAEKDPKINMFIDTRVDFESFLHSDTLPHETGFSGKYLMLSMNGNINEKFSYMFRHRFNVAPGSLNSFFGSTDYAWISYQINKNFSITAGKQAVGIGGYEYDYAPIDVYIWSNFWNNVDCFRTGLTLTYATENHTFLGQFQNSPFSTNGLSSLFAYNAMWYGKMGDFNTIYSLNALEYKKNQYIYYIALGNQFKFDKFVLEVDYMNRYSPKHSSFWKDFSVIGKLRYNLNSKFDFFIKGGHDQNSAQTNIAPEASIPDVAGDLFVLPGTKYNFYGLGAEYYPLKDRRDLRIHAFLAQNNWQTHTLQFSLGVRWKIQAI